MDKLMEIWTIKHPTLIQTDFLIIFLYKLYSLNTNTHIVP